MSKSISMNVNEADVIPVDGLTFAQMAAQLGVSKEALRKKITRDKALGQAMDKHVYSVHGTKYIDVQGQELLKSQYLTTKVKVRVETVSMVEKPVSMDDTMDKTMDNVRGQGMDKVVDALLEQLKTKDEQITRLQRALEQEQALHLATKQMMLTAKSQGKKGLIDRVKDFFGGVANREG